MMDKADGLHNLEKMLEKNHSKCGEKERLKTISENLLPELKITPETNKLSLPQPIDCKSLLNTWKK